MKRLFSLTALLFVLLFAQHSHAQLLSGDLNSKRDSTPPKAEFGVKLGANAQSVSGQTWENNYNTGISGGVWARVYKKKIGVRIEALLSTFRFNTASLTDSAGNKYYAIADSAGNKGDFHGTYVDVPLMFEYSVVPNVLIQAGFQYSQLLALSKLTSITGGYLSIFNQGEFAGLVGVEVKLPANLSIGARYKYGFTNINNKAESSFSDDWRTNAFQFYIAYKIR